LDLFVLQAQALWLNLGRKDEPPIFTLNEYAKMYQVIDALEDFSVGWTTFYLADGQNNKSEGSWKAATTLSRRFGRRAVSTVGTGWENIPITGPRFWIGRGAAWQPFSLPPFFS
jgi:hypothetical protein